jgi:hypothetical protein
MPTLSREPRRYLSFGADRLVWRALHFARTIPRPKQRAGRHQAIASGASSEGSSEQQEHGTEGD